MPNPRIALRPATAADAAFLRGLFGEPRRAELLASGVGEREADLLVELQFRAQDAQYHSAFPLAERAVVEVDDIPAGRLVVDRRTHELRIVDSAVSTAFRGRGVGSSLLNSLQVEAAQSGQVLCLRVARGNPAQRLYERLGFREVAGDEIYVEMAWVAEAGGLASGVIRQDRGAAA
jgi:ribosomal protein S18 acetylase RimI-like enzyme